MTKAELLAAIAAAGDDWNIDIIDGSPIIRTRFTIELTPAERVIEFIIEYDENEGEGSDDDEPDPELVQALKEELGEKD